MAKWIGFFVIPPPGYMAGTVFCESVNLGFWGRGGPVLLVWSFMFYD